MKSLFAISMPPLSIKTLAWLSGWPIACWQNLWVLPLCYHGGGQVPDNSRFADYRNAPEPRQRAMADRFLNDRTMESTARYMELAAKAGMSAVTLATAWSMQHDFVASTIIGARTADQLEESLAALDVTLSDEVMKECDEVHASILYPMG